MAAKKLNEFDKKTVEEVVVELNLENDSGPEIAMTSIGYVEVWADGTVISYGNQVYQCDVDISGKNLLTDS